MQIKDTQPIMGMPITVVIDDVADKKECNVIFDYFRQVDEKFSPFKENSELEKINRGEIMANEVSSEMREVLAKCEQTKSETHGYFDIAKPDGKIDTSGLVKGWSILNAAKLLSKKGHKIFYVEAGGDIQAQGKYWKIGIKNPFDQKQIIKIVYLKDEGIATSGTYIRGQHIYNPITGKKEITDIVSLTVIGPNVYDADRFATAAFAMGKIGINFIENLPGFEGYMIDSSGVATVTSGFEKYTNNQD